jgi:hypothetical protein
MDLDALGNIGDFLGGIGVVITLAYLAFQIRHGARATRAATIQAVFSDATACSRLIGSSPQVATVWRRGCNSPKDLSEEELTQFFSLAIAILRNLENMFTQFRIAGDDESAWEQWDLSAREQMRNPGLQFFWRHRRDHFGHRFRDYIDSVIPDEKDAGHRA